MRATVPIQVFGKRQDRQLVAAVTASEESKLLYVTDSRSGRRFLVDSGSQKSLILPSYANRLAGTSGSELTATNSSDIKTFAPGAGPTTLANVTAPGDGSVVGKLPLQTVGLGVQYSLSLMSTQPVTDVIPASPTISGCRA
ncbi:uncharacterized protein KZ484_018615 isoform 1-T1 [Pholidichthys leucotaenia]